MPRQDYEKFIRLADTELGNQFYITTINNDAHHSTPWLKVKKKNTLFVMDPKTASLDRGGIFVDVFPFDEISEKSKTESYRLMVYSIISACINWRKNRTDATWKIKLLSKLLTPVPISVLSKFMNKCVIGHGNMMICYGGAYPLQRKKYKITDILPTTNIMFEGKAYPAPQHFDAVLQQLYGEDYMLLPPVEKRKTHLPQLISFDVENDQLSEWMQ